MSRSQPVIDLDQFKSFGDLLRYLRRRSGLTQRELSIAVGYSESQISRLEQNQRLPDLAILSARFVSELGLADQPKVVERLLALAIDVRREDAPVAGLPPFRGLLHFDEADSELFFGRESLTDRLLARLQSLLATPGAPRFLAVIGASGSGKSSLVRAGLVPGLRWNTQSAAWPVHVLTPGAHPLEALAGTLLGTINSATAQMVLADALRHDHAALHRAVQRETQRAAVTHAVLIVDQFEELFTLCRSGEERRAFVDSLMWAARAEVDTPSTGVGGNALGGSAIVVAVLRADFYAECAVYPDLRQTLAAQQEYIGAMTAVELRRAIEEPARYGHWELEPGLVELLLHDLGVDGGHPPEPGALPLLSHALLETWHRRRGNRLTLSGYAASGGLRGAIAETAEAVLHDQLTLDQRLVARRVFLRLTELGGDAAMPDTRRRTRLAELLSDAPDSGPVRQVLTVLADSRLVTTDQDTVEVAHEALIREWPTLREWLAEDREGLRLHRRLTEAAHEWERAGHGEAELYRGARLAQAAEWVAAHPNTLNVLECSFVEASQALARRETDEREAQRQRELQAARQLAEAHRLRADESTRAATQLRRRAAYFAGAFTLALVLAVVAVYFGQQAQQSARDAQRASRLAFSRELVAASLGNLQSDPQLSLLLALEAYSRIQQDQLPNMPEVEDALHRALWALSPGQEWFTLSEGAGRLAFSPDGNRLAVSQTPDATTPIWDTATGTVILSLAGHSRPVMAVAFDQTGAHLATASADNTTKIWDAANGVLEQTLSGHDNRVNDVAFSPDGTKIVTVSDDFSAFLWNLASPASPLKIHDFHPIEAVAFSPDGRQFATAHEEGHALLWDAATGESVRILSGHQAQVRDVAYGPACAEEGSRGNACRLLVATAGADRLVRLWDADTGEHLRTLAGHSGAVTAVSLSPNGNRLATASEDGTVRLWDVATGQQLLNLLQAGTSIDDVTFSPDGAYLAASSANNVWVFLARVESLAALARSRATRPLSPSECTRFLHLPPESCPGAPTRPTVTPLAAIAAHRLCQVTDPPEWAYDLTVERTGDGVEAAAAGLSWEATVLYPASMVDIAAKTAQLSASDCDLIVAPIYNGSAAIEAAAQRNPGRKYLIWEGIAPRTLPNLWVQTYATHQAAFLAGYAAASVSQTGKVGTFGGTAYPAVLAFMNGFALGVAHYNLQHAQHVEVLGWNVDQQDGLFIGGFCCEAEGAAWANQLLAGGADVILPVAGTQVGQGAAQAVQQHGNAYVIGVDVDYALALPGGLGAAVLTSIEKRQDVSVGLAATAVALGSFSGGLHVGTLASGEVGLSPFYDHASLISDRVTAELEQISADIIAGHLKTSP